MSDKRLKEILKQSSIIFTEKIVFQFISLLSNIILARLLGSSLLGMYQLGLTCTQLLHVLCRVGFDQGLIRYIPIFSLYDNGKVKKLINFNISFVLVISISFGILMYFYADFLATRLFHSKEMTQVLKSYSFFLPVITLMTLFMAILKGFKRADISSHVENIFIPASFILLLWIVSMIEVNISNVIFVRILSTLCPIGYILYFLFNKYSFVFHSNSLPINLKNYFSFSFPLMFVGFLYLLINQIDILMLGYFVESDKVGIYSMGVKISMLSIFGLQAINSIFAPHISEIYEKGEHDSLEKLLKVLTKWIFYFSLFIFAIIVNFNKELMQIFGENFIIGSRCLIILAFGQLINSVTGPTGTILIMIGKQKWEVLNSIIIIILNGILNYIMIPRYGIEGAATATAISVSFINILKLLETYKELKILPYTYNYLKGLTSCLIGFIIVYLLKIFFYLVHLNYIISVLIGSCAMLISFFIVLLFLKFDEEDEIILKKLSAKLGFNK